MASYDLAPPAKRPCPVGREQLVERLSLEGVSVRNNVRLATLLETANAHGLLALAPEPQTSILDLPMELIENILHKALSDPERRRQLADVLFSAASTCKLLAHLIMGDPNSLLWRTAWSAVACQFDSVKLYGASLEVFGEPQQPQPFMLRVKLLARDTCQFCANLNRYTRIIHWKLGVRCCPQCFKSQTCTVHWAQHHCQLPAELVASLPSEGVYDRYAPNRETFRVLKRDLGPLLQQVHGKHVTSVAAYERQCADDKQAKADALAARRKQAAERKALKLAKQQEKAEKKRLKEEKAQAKAAAKAAAANPGQGGAAAATEL